MSVDAPQQNPLAQLLAVAREVSFVKGAELVRQGEPSRGAFLIRTGAAEARVALPGGGSQVVAQFGAGEMFGEMALLERGVVTATVVARANVDGWFVGRDDFRALVASRDAAALEVQRAVTKTLADKLRTLNERINEFPAVEVHAAIGSPPASDPLADSRRSRRASFDWKVFLPLLPLFEGFDAEEIDEVVSIAKVLELPRGAWVFAAGLPAPAAFLVIRGAVEIFTRSAARGMATERRIAIAGPGELIGFIALLRGAAHGGDARVREACCLLELPRAGFMELYNGSSGATVSLHHAIHRSLMRSLARTNTQFTRLISHARLTKATKRAEELVAALRAQIVGAAGAD